MNPKTRKTVITAVVVIVVLVVVIFAAQALVSSIDIPDLLKKLHGG